VPERRDVAPPGVTWKLIASAAGALAVAAVLIMLIVWQGQPPGESQPSPPPTPPVEDVVSPPPRVVESEPQRPPLPALASLRLEQLPAGVQVLLDGVSIGTVGANGTLAYAGVTPGAHRLEFIVAGYERLTLERTFTAPQMLVLSKNDIVLKRLGTLDVVADAGAQVTVLQKGRTIQRTVGAAKLQIPEGTYDVRVSGAAGVPVTRTVSIASGATQSFDVRNIIVTAMERFDSAGWTRQETWFRRRGGGFSLYNHSNPVGRFTFTVRLDRDGNPFSTASRLKWVVGFIDNSTHVMMQLDEDSLYRLDIAGGTRQQERIPHRIPTSVPFVHFNVQISASWLIHQYSVDGTNWRMLDTWNRPTPATPEKGRRWPLDGRFGFYLPGDEEVSVSNFLYQPESR
jgi:hypothetical protein